MSWRRRALFEMRGALVAACVALVGAVACGVREATPPGRTRDARFGFFGGASAAPRDEVCSSWMGSVVAHDEHAITHVSFPETNLHDSCYVRVEHRGEDVARPLDEPARGCGFPNPPAQGALAKTIAELDAIALTPSRSSRFFECGMREADKRVTAAHNAKVLRALAASSKRWPYAAIVVPGHGLGAQSKSKLTSFVPGAGCVAFEAAEHDALGGMMPRTRRAAALVRGQVAPIAIVSGAAVHSILNESFAMLHLMACPRSDVPSHLEAIAPEQVLLEPCADHTHTNLRNAAIWLDAIGARAAYIITDDFLQSKYFQDQNGFELLMGSIDQRSIRDFGYVIGSWRQASVGLSAGFWFTPYRFWAEPRDGLGSLTCATMR